MSQNKDGMFPGDTESIDEILKEIGVAPSADDGTVADSGSAADSSSAAEGESVADSDSAAESSSAAEGNSVADSSSAAQTADTTRNIAGDDEFPDEEVPAEDADGEEAPPMSVKELVAKVKDVIAFLDLSAMGMLRLIAVYFFAFGVHILRLKKMEIDAVGNWKGFVGEIDFGMVVVSVLAGVLALSLVAALLPKKIRRLEPLLAVASVLFFDVALLWGRNDLYLTFGVTAVTVALLWYVLSKFEAHDTLHKLPWWGWGAAALALGVGVTVFISVATVHRHYVFGTGAHDFGLFVQSFHSLAENGTAVNSCERDTLMSHFNIHASYIFYLLVPVFKLFPQEETLLIAQAVLAMGGVIPLVLIAKKRNFKGLTLLGIAAAYVFCVGLIAPCFYEFHENAFLPTLLMWVLWAVDGKKVIPFYVFSVLTCIVKEDAPLFIICIGLYWFFEHKGERLRTRLHGIVAASASGAYMVYITNWLTEHGDGQMMTSSRFNHLLLDPEGGFFEIVKNTLSDPGYFFSLLVREQNDTQQGTLVFFLQIMVPLLFLPFFTKKLHRYWLMMPFIITNLVIGANYGYAAQIGYQYIFGPVTLLIFMSMVNVDDMSEQTRRSLPVLLGSVALLFMAGTVAHRIDYVDRYKADEAFFVELEGTLDAIPEGSVIGADAFYVAHMADREEVYIFDFGDLNADRTALTEPDRYDYIVLPLNSDIFAASATLLDEQGYSVWASVQDRVIIAAREKAEGQ